MQEDRLGAAFEDLVHMLLLENRLAVHDHVVSLDGNHLARILVHEVLDPRRKHRAASLRPTAFLRLAFVTFTSSARSKISRICWSAS